MLRFVGPASRLLSGSYARSSTVAVRGFASQLDDAAKRLKTLQNEPDNETKLKIYGLFKQATVGPCNTAKPGAFDFVAKAKWTAWKKLEGVSKEQAEKDYVSLVDQLVKEEKASATPQTMDAGEGVVVVKEKGVLRVRLDRPSKKNSLTLEMYRQLIDLVNNSAKDPSVHYFVLTGTGDFFSSGNDLSNFTETLKKGGDINKMAKDAAELVREYIAAFIDFPKPMIALINGPSIGVSCTVLGLFDLIYASDRATFQTPFSQLGLNPEGCSSFTFPRRMGAALAAEVLLMNRQLSAEEAKRVGFITDVFPAASFEAECQKKIDYIARQPPKSQMYSKMLIRAPDKEALHKVNVEECKRLEERFVSEEAMKAVMEFFKGKSSKM